MAEKKVTENEAAPKKTVKKTITKVDSAKATTPAEKPSTKTAAKAATPVTAADKSSAKTKRILAVVFWVLAIACEVLAVLVFIGKIDLKFISQMAQLIAFLVIDFILVVVGAQFWKQANHMDPVSEQNKVKFWLWNNMGVIVCCFAFIPFLIYVLFIDKNADPKMKKVASIVAAVALVLGVGLSYDWHPVSQEGLAKARQAVAASAKEYAEKAADLVEARSEQEYQRMNHLMLMRGRGGSSTALQQLKKNVTERRKIVSTPQLRLDAIRLLVCR